MKERETYSQTERQRKEGKEEGAKLDVLSVQSEQVESEGHIEEGHAGVA